ncbi:MAG: RHS repeat protein [Planctomycetes bacterium]|nr:RHS repeat protein [Planctomycetota bacterium]
MGRRLGGRALRSTLAAVAAIAALAPISGECRGASGGTGTTAPPRRDFEPPCRPPASPESPPLESSFGDARATAWHGPDSTMTLHDGGVAQPMPSARSPGLLARALRSWQAEHDGRADSVAAALDPALHAAGPANRGDDTVQPCTNLLDAAQRCEVDALLPGVGIDFVFARTYRSGITRHGALGHNWVHSYEVAIESDGAGALLLHDGTGRTDRFTLQLDGTFGADGFFLEGTFGPGGEFTFVFPDGGSWEFHPLDGAPQQGKLRAIRDRNGNEMRLEYDARGRLATVRDPLDTPAQPRTITFSYGAGDRLRAMRDWSGRVWRYDYWTLGDGGGGPGDLQSVTLPAVVGTPNGNDFPLGRTTTYTYARGFADERRNHNLLSITDPLGNTFARYDWSATSDPAALDFDRVARITLGHASETIELVYERVVPSPTNGDAVVRVIVNDRVGNVREYLLDGANRVVAALEFTGRANPSVPTTSSTNRPTAPLRGNDPPSFVRRWQWNADSLLVSERTPEGSETLLAWESNVSPTARRRTRGNLRQVTRLAGPRGGDQALLVEQLDYQHAPGATRGLSFPTRTVDARGHASLHAYDAAGNRVQTIHRIASIVEDWSYDARGRPLRHDWPQDQPGHRRTDLFRWQAAAGPAHGCLKEIVVDAAGFALSTRIEYDRLRRPVRVIDPKGNDDLLEWADDDRLRRARSRIVTPGTSLRHEQLFAFDANGNLVRTDVEQRDENGALHANPWLTTTYDYELLNRRIRITEEVEDGVAPPVVTEFEWNGNRNLERVRKGEATNGNQPTNTLTYRYDERDLTFEEIRAAGDPAQVTTRFDYDGDGNLAARRVARSPQPALTTWRYDGFERLVAVTDAMGNVRTLHLDENGNPVRETLVGELDDQPGAALNVPLEGVTRAFDAMDRPIRADADWFDRATGSAIGDGARTTQWSWLDAGLLATTTDDLGRVTTQEWDDALRLHATVDARGNRRQLDYDANSNIVARVETDLSDLGTPPETFTTSFEHDGRDREIGVIDSAGAHFRSGLDSLGRALLAIDPLDNVVRSTFDGLGRCVRRETFLTDDGTGGGAPIGSLVESTLFDASSRTIATIDPNGQVTTTTWDALDRPVAQTLPDGTTRSSSFDALDVEVASLDGNGTSVAWTCDALGRRRAAAIAPGPGVSAQTTFLAFERDGSGQLVGALDDDSSVTREYDSLGNLVQELQGTATLTQSHDGVGNVVLQVHPAGRKIARSYDPLDRAVAVGDSGALPLASWSFAGPARAAACELANGTRTTWSHDARRRTATLSLTRDPSGANVLLQSRATTWDARSSCASESDLLAGIALRQWSYDSAGRLAQSLEPATGLQVDYLLDPAGNRIVVAGGGGAGPYALDPTLPIPGDFQRNQYSDAPSGHRDYDENGNVVAQNGGAGATSFAWDFADRLVEQVDLASGAIVTHRYDALGRRLRKEIAAGGTVAITDYRFDGELLIEECDGGGVLLASYVHAEASSATSRGPSNGWGAGGRGAPLVMTRGGGDLYLHGDALGSVRALLDGAGTIVEQCDYDDFGAPSFFDGAGVPLAASAQANPFAFRGMRLESYDGYDRAYAGAGGSGDGTLRYDPTIGRWLNGDGDPGPLDPNAWDALGRGKVKDIRNTGGNNFADLAMRGRGKVKSVRDMGSNFADVACAGRGKVKVIRDNGGNGFVGDALGRGKVKDIRDNGFGFEGEALGRGKVKSIRDGGNGFWDTEPDLVKVPGSTVKPKSTIPMSHGDEPGVSSGGGSTGGGSNPNVGNQSSLVNVAGSSTIVPPKPPP